MKHNDRLDIDRRDRPRRLRPRSGQGVTVTNDWRDNLSWPEAAELTVRVSIPSQGAFSAGVPGNARPYTLVDTRWLGR